MLRNIFPVDRVVQTPLVDTGGLLTHDDLVSIICFRDKSVEKPILFQYLVTNNCDGRSVIYITREPLVELPEPVDGMPPVNPISLDVVTFVYINSARQLTDYLADLHTLPVLPNVLMIQDLSFYIGQYQGDSFNAKCAKMFALIKETAKFLATKFCSVGEAKLLISMDAKEEDLVIVKKLFKNLWLVNEDINSSEYSMELHKGGALFPCLLLFQSVGGRLCDLRFSRQS